MPETTRLAGASVADLRKALKELGGAEYEGALAAVPAATRDAFVSATAVDWVNVDVVEEVITAVARRLGQNPTVFNQQVNRISTERTFSTVWRFFLRYTSDLALLGRAPMMYRRVYDQGELRLTFPQAGRADVKMRGRPGISEMAAAAFGAGTARVLELTGRKNVEMQYARMADGADFTFTWEP